MPDENVVDPLVVTPYPPAYGGGGGSGTGSPGDDNGGYNPSPSNDPPPAPPSTPEQQASLYCPIRAQIIYNRQQGNANVEYLGVTVSVGGNSGVSPLRAGAATAASLPDAENILKSQGYPSNTFVGNIHSHPMQDTSGAIMDYNQLNKTPSQQDWNAAVASVTRNSPSDYQIVILGPDDQLRVFNYADRDKWNKPDSERVKWPDSELPRPLSCP